jgi:WD40 repeat protein
MRPASLAVSTLLAATAALGLAALALADDVKQPDAPECKGFLTSASKRARLSALWGSYAFRHEDPVRALGFADEGRAVIAVTERALTVWERASGREELTAGAAAPCVLSPSGKRVLVLGAQLECLELATKKTLWTADVKASAAVFSQDEKRALAATAASELVLLDAEKGRTLHTLHPDAPAELVALSADGKKAVSGAGPKLVLWDALHGAKLRELASEKGFTRLVWQDDLLVTGDQGGKVVSWDQGTGKPRWEHALKAPVVALAVAARRVVSASEDGTVVVRDAAGAGLQSFEHAGVRSGAVSPDGLLVATASSTVRLFSLETGKRVPIPGDGHEGPVLGLALSADRLHAISTGADHAAFLWNVGDAKPFRTFAPHAAAATAAAFSEDGTRALTASDDGAIAVWDLKTGASQLALKEAGPVGAVGFLAGKALALGTDGQLHAFELEKGKKVADWGAASPRAPVALAGKLALVAHERGPIKLWDLDLGREVRTLDERSDLRVLALSADGKRALTGGPGTLRLWDAQSATELRALDVGGETVTAVALSEDSKLGLSATADGKIALWELDTGQKIDGLDLATSHDRAVSALLTRDGFLLGTARGVVLRFDWIGV